MKKRKYIYLILGGANLHLQMDRPDGYKINRVLLWEAIDNAIIDIVEHELDDMERLLEREPSREIAIIGP